MPRAIVAKGLRFSLRHAPCAHICRYCLISQSRKRSALPFSRFEKLVHRFHDWKQSDSRDDLEIGIFVGPSFDYDLETLKGVARLHTRREDHLGDFAMIGPAGGDALGAAWAAAVQQHHVGVLGADLVECLRNTSRKRTSDLCRG